MKVDDHIAFEILSGYTHFTTDGAMCPQDIYNHIHNKGDVFVQGIRGIYDSEPHSKKIKTKRQASQITRVYGALLENIIDELSEVEIVKANKAKFDSDFECMKTISDDKFTRDELNVIQDTLLDFSVQGYFHIGLHLGRIAAKCQGSSEVVFIM